MITSTLIRRTDNKRQAARRGDEPDVSGPDTHAEAHALAVTKAAGTSFYWAMRLLPPRRRTAMFAIYAFCREVDDIADGDDSADEKLRRLDEWRGEIDAVYDGTPTLLTARALSEPVRAFALDRQDFHAIIDGMEMDVGEPIVAPSQEMLESYCRRVAGAVGLLSIRAFGAEGPRAREFALALGSALQMTNILRDLKEDAAAGRLYLPRELLRSHGIESRVPDEILSDPALSAACAEFAATARARFRQADVARAASPGKALRPAIVMMKMYERILTRLIRRGWRNLDRVIAVPKFEKFWIAIRHGLL